ncbi:hypothetical protein LDO26_14515 [Luteimonas sp. BDR2-5]|uniref:helix-turn-helix transcriptional regulator n=1 Tax=Proluteimonas luteida TaxID=2878685 RepID=UPI001E5F1307|nr:hypothetical protein [Luteimonas sp. BDR2-5]MCD9029405.1 hypothetical protein [Luteimonas sp. BDR2-5]
MKSAETIQVEEPRYLRPRQAALRYSVSTVTLWRLIKAGVLPQPRRLGERCTLLDREATDAAFEKHLAGGAS